MMKPPYRVFSAFYRRHYAHNPCYKPLPVPQSLAVYRRELRSLIDSNDQLPEPGRWSDKFSAHWNPGEQGAMQRAENFLETGLSGYSNSRDFPQQSPVSGLSPHLCFGELSPRQILVNAAAESAHEGLEEDYACFHKELVWREFSAYQLFHWPDLPSRNLDARFDRFPWKRNADKLHCWKTGMTGFPLLDAAMRELWQTGYMHNRMRMVTASFLVKHLMIDWRVGERWFRHCLLDADLASNSANWQWVAGCGLDAAPYFRVFNPLTQSQKFDPQGLYIRHYLPQIRRLPNRYIHSPSDAPADVLAAAGVSLGANYPDRILDLAESRKTALNAFQSIR